MALMFPRVARNFARNGYFPTDEVTLERTLQALSPVSGATRILDPCAGEGVALAEAAHALGRDRVQAFGVEYDPERAEHARTLLDRTLRSDLMDTIIARQTFGLLWLNPPYGDLPSQYGEDLYQGSGRKRLEKLFYQRTFPLLQYGGIMVLIIPHYALDAEFGGWIGNHFDQMRIYNAPERQFKQVVIFGIRCRRSDREDTAHAKAVRDRLIAVGKGDIEAEELPEEWPFERYVVPPAQKDLTHFYRITLEPEQFAREIQRLGGLWSEFRMHFHRAGRVPRRPARALSPWHLALSLAAGAISGVITSPATGNTLVVKGNTYKTKSCKVEHTEDDDGNISETRIMIDRFVPVIKAWDMTPGSSTFGQVLTISSSTAEAKEEIPEASAEPQFEEAGPLMALKTLITQPAFPPGRIVCTRGVHGHVLEGTLNVLSYLDRHLSGDWGDLSSGDRLDNNRGVKTGGRLLSSYNLDRHYPSDFGTDDKLWIITEWDRSVTTVLFPSEY